MASQMAWRWHLSRRSLIYGDRHPDKGLFYIDCSSLRNFVKGPFFETSFAILILINTIFMALEYQFNGLLIGLEIGYLDTVTAQHWPWAVDTFEASEWFFGLAFSLELLLKLAGLKRAFFKAWTPTLIHIRHIRYYRHAAYYTYLTSSCLHCLN